MLNLELSGDSGLDAVALYVALPPTRLETLPLFECQYISMCNILSTQVLLIAFHMPTPNLPLHCQTWQLHQHPTKWVLLAAYLVLTPQLHDWTDDLFFGQACICAFKPGCLMSHNWLNTPDCKV